MSTEQAVPSGREATSTAVYVYGVGRADAVRGGGSGIGGSPVEPLVHRSLAAITGRVETPVRARRRDLLLHSEVLQHAFTAGTVLPLRFGTVFPTTHEVVERLLAPRHDELVQQLSALDGSSELTVRAFYVEEEVLGEIVRETPRIARLREATRAATASDHPLAVQLGEAVARELSARRERDSQDILTSLMPLAQDVVTEEQRAELEVVRASFLVDNEHVPEFDARMDDLARRHEGRIVFKYVGPLPPHSFVSLDGTGTG
jgi:hypothetical protein